ncbi:hypothetical protein ACHQM5_000820 [Ranunculus cassubicifolius]
MMTSRGTLIRLLSKSSISPSTKLNCYESLRKSITDATNLPSIRHLSSSPSWHLVNNYSDLVLQAKQTLQSPIASSSSTDRRRHWLVVLRINVADFPNQLDLLRFYVKTLARVLPSEEEAMKKIYLVSRELCFGFGAEIDQATKYKLQVEQGVAFVLEDYYYETRQKDLRVCPVPQFTMVDRNHQLLDIYSYHYLSATISDCNSNYWLVHVNPPDSGFNSERETIEFYYHLLAEVVGSEEEAKKKIYIVWCKTPFGFAAEIDEETSNKLKGRPDVLMVFPDHACGVKKKNRNGKDYNYNLHCV